MITTKPYTPDPKPTKRKRNITYKYSDGTRVTQSQIDSRRKAIYRQMDAKLTGKAKYRCAAYPLLNWNDHDHTIS